MLFHPQLAIPQKSLRRAHLRHGDDQFVGPFGLVGVAKFRSVTTQLRLPQPALFRMVRVKLLSALLVFGRRPHYSQNNGAGVKVEKVNLGMIKVSSHLRFTNKYLDRLKTGW